MPETVQIILGLLLLVVVYVLTQMVVGWRIKRAARWVVADLDRRKAYSADTAVALPYARTQFFRIGLRDFRPKAVAALLQAGIVARTPADGYFLLKRPGSLNF